MTKKKKNQPGTSTVKSNVLKCPYNYELCPLIWMGKEEPETKIHIPILVGKKNILNYKHNFTIVERRNATITLIPEINPLNKEGKPIISRFKDEEQRPYVTRLSQQIEILMNLNQAEWLSKELQDQITKANKRIKKKNQITKKKSKAKITNLKEGTELGGE